MMSDKKAKSLLSFIIAFFAVAIHTPTSAQVGDPDGRKVIPHEETTTQLAEINCKTTNLHDGHEVLDGWLKLDLIDDDVIDKLGNPASRTAPVLWGALGMYVEEWHYSDKGLRINMASTAKEGEKKVLTITVDRSSQMQTSCGIKTGARERDVLTAYKGVINTEWSEAGRAVVLGSIYGGTIFTISGDRVEEIFIGAAAE